MPEWDADVVVDEALVRALLAEQFPELDASTARLVAEGWDNAVWAVEEQWAFRFPRREIAVPLVAREVAILPRLAPLLPLAIPTPTLLGRPGSGYPWPFFACPLIPGVELTDADLADDDRTVLGVRLGVFLRALHAPEVAERADPDRVLATDPLKRADIAVRVPRTRARMGELAELGLWTAPPKVDDVFATAERLPAAEHTSLVHGDLHFRHVLVDGPTPSGVIDWGDMCRADPSVDLVLYWCALRPEGRAAFIEAYGPVADDRLLRARVLALFLCSILAVYGHHERFSGVERESLAGLERTLVD